MTPLSQRLPGFAILFAAISSPVLAEARTQHRDFAECPCRSFDRLVVKSDDQSFAIVRRDFGAPRHDNKQISFRTEIKLGVAHKIDRSIFTPEALAAEIIHARR